MAVQGVFTSDTGITGNRKGDFASSILQLYPTGTAPFFALTAGMESAGATDPIITWFEETHITGRSTVTTGSNDTTTTTQTVDDASSYVPNVYVLVEETGEYLLITGVNGNVLTVSRGFAGTTPVNLTTGYHLQRIGTTFEEGSARPVAVANQGYPAYNFMQIFRNTWDVTGTARVTEHYTGDLVAKNKADCMQMHAEDIERALWFGKATQSVRSGKPYRTMDGILNIIKTNVTVAGSTTTYDQLDDFFRPIFERNVRGKPNERIAFCGNAALQVINRIARKNTTVFIEPGETKAGLKINKWMTPFGDITLMTHPLMVEQPVWTKNLYVLHPGACRIRYLRRTRTDNYDSDGSRAGNDSDFGVLTSELSLEYKLEKTGGQLLGLTAAA